jgi:DNA-binding NarL/FixJ family response regulator
MFVNEATKVKVVVADDSPLVRRRLISLLNEVADVEIVGEAVDGLDALDVVNDQKPDVVFLDIQMPGMTGLEVLRRLQKKASPPIVVMVTNYAFPQYREKCLQAGASFFLDKSADFDKIPEVIRDLRSETSRPPKHQTGSMGQQYSN